MIMLTVRESFFRKLKAGQIHYSIAKTGGENKQLVPWYIEVYYDRYQATFWRQCLKSDKLWQMHLGKGDVEKSKYIS